MIARVGLILLVCLLGEVLARVEMDQTSLQCAFDNNCRKPMWIKRGRAPPNEEHSVILAIKMKEKSADACDSLLMDISDPDSPNYGNHLTMSQIKDMFTVPKRATIVANWLNKNQVAQKNIQVTTNEEFIKIRAPVYVLEALLDTKFYRFDSNHAKGNEISIFRTERYSLPEEIASLIDYVSSTVRFPAIHAEILMSQRVNDDGNVTPDFIGTYYNITKMKVSSSQATQSVFESLGQSFSPDDLTQFQQTFNVPQVPVANVIGPNSPSNCSSNPNNCVEANLDVQFITSVAQYSPTTYWSVVGSDDVFLDWITAVSGATNPPLVHSVSYGSIATEDPKQDMARFNTEVCKMGLRGLTVMVASGDDGVANYIARNDQSQCGFQPSYPATSPYVTTVGATQGPELGDPEIACTSATGGLITSGGGFSFFFQQPTYQTSAVTQYLNNAPNLPPTNLFNTGGRAYPDVAVMGHNYPIIIGGSEYVGSGTSASSPVFAGMVTLINGLRISAGKKPVGFINPALYKFGASNLQVFRDITSGENNCCAGYPGQQVCCQYGFNATVGWDPITGWGSVNFLSLSNAFMSLP